mgnify:CR=1 FL=1
MGVDDVKGHARHVKNHIQNRLLDLIKTLTNVGCSTCDHSAINFAKLRMHGGLVPCILRT